MWSRTDVRLDHQKTNPIFSVIYVHDGCEKAPLMPTAPKALLLSVYTKTATKIGKFFHDHEQGARLIVALFHQLFFVCSF